jgi:hypothetical protein
MDKISVELPDITDSEKRQVLVEDREERIASYRPMGDKTMNPHEKMVAADSAHSRACAAAPANSGRGNDGRGQTGAGGTGAAGVGNGRGWGAAGEMTGVAEAARTGRGQGGEAQPPSCTASRPKPWSCCSQVGACQWTLRESSGERKGRHGETRLHVVEEKDRETPERELAHM